MVKGSSCDKYNEPVTCSMGLSLLNPGDWGLSPWRVKYSGVGAACWRKCSVLALYEGKNVHHFKHRIDDH